MPLNLPVELRLQIYDHLFDLCWEEIANHASRKDHDASHVPLPGDQPPVDNLVHVAECAVPNADPRDGPSTFSHRISSNAVHGLMLADRGSLDEIRFAKSRYESRMEKNDPAASKRRSQCSAELRITHDGPRDADWTASLSWTFLPFFMEPPFDIELTIRLDGQNPSLTQQFNPITAHARASGHASKMFLICHILDRLSADGPPFANFASSCHVLERVRKRCPPRTNDNVSFWQSLFLAPVTPWMILNELHIRLVAAPLNVKNPKHAATRMMLDQSRPDMGDDTEDDEKDGEEDDQEDEQEDNKEDGKKASEEEGEEGREYTAYDEMLRCSDAHVIMSHIEGLLERYRYTSRWAVTTQFTWHGYGGKARFAPVSEICSSRDSIWWSPHGNWLYGYDDYIQGNGY